MKDYFTDILFVIAYSGRTKTAIILGILGFIVIQLIGDYALNNFQLSVDLPMATEVIKDKFGERFEKAAWIILLSFWGMAVKFYNKDKKKFWDHF